MLLKMNFMLSTSENIINLLNFLGLSNLEFIQVYHQLKDFLKNEISFLRLSKKGLRIKYVIDI